MFKFEELRFATIFILAGIISAVNAQKEASVSVGVTAYSNGYGMVVNANKDANRNGRSWGDLKFEWSNIYHQKEISIVNNLVGSVNAYKFGKINHAWAWRAGWGGRKVLAVRKERKAMGMNFSYHTGPSIAYHFPVYIYRYVEGQSQQEDRLEVVRYDPAVHTQNKIAGKAPFTRGLFQGGIIPGWHIDAGLDYLWGNYQTDHKQLSLGVRLEAYADQVPILYDSKWNRQFYTSFYITFALGSIK